MKKLVTFLLVAQLALLGLWAEDNVIYWMFDDPPVLTGEGSFIAVSDLSATVDGEMYTANMIRITATDSAGNKTYLELGNDTIGYLDGWGLPDPNQAWKAGPSYADLSGLASLSTATSFMVEIGCAKFGGEDDSEIVNWVVLAVSESRTLQQLGEAGHVFSNQLNYQGTTAWKGGAYVVPEPSSGVLLLVGAGLLSLRRRRWARV